MTFFSTSEGRSTPLSLSIDKLSPGRTDMRNTSPTPSRAIPITSNPQPRLAVEAGANTLIILFSIVGFSDFCFDYQKKETCFAGVPLSLISRPGPIRVPTPALPRGPKSIRYDKLEIYYALPPRGNCGNGSSGSCGSRSSYGASVQVEALARNDAADVYPRIFHNGCKATANFYTSKTISLFLCNLPTL